MLTVHKNCINHQVSQKSHELDWTSFYTWTYFDLLNLPFSRMSCMGMDWELLLFDLQKDHSHHCFVTKVPVYVSNWYFLFFKGLVIIALQSCWKFYCHSLAAAMLRLKTFLLAELWFCVISTMILILHRHQGPDWDLITEIQMPHLKIVLQILLRFYYFFI